MASFEAEMEVPYMSDFKITGKGPTLKKNPSLKWWILEIPLTDKVFITELEIILNAKGSGKVTSYTENTRKCHCCIIQPSSGKVDGLAFQWES